MAWSEVSFLKLNAKVIRLFVKYRKQCGSGFQQGVNTSLVCVITDYAGRGAGRADCNLQRALPKGVGVYGLLMTTQTAKVLVLCSDTHGYPKQC